MAIRDRVRRALRKSEASDAITQTSSNSSNTTSSTANTSQSSGTGSPLTKTTSRLFGFGSRDRGSKDKDRKKRLHPSEKPLTAQNLRHQELLSHFTMTFGASDPNQIESLSFIGVSPCCTRPGSRRASVDLAPDESAVQSSAASTV